MILYPVLILLCNITFPDPARDLKEPKAKTHYGRRTAMRREAFAHTVCFPSHVLLNELALEPFIF
jgi:hypothetical protein